jgi:hypothetical protein
MRKKLIFKSDHQGKVFDAAVAVDQIEFFDCGLPPAQQTCEEAQFHCVISKACVYQVQGWPLQCLSS